MSDKLKFASQAWIDKARAILEELAAEHGEDGQLFSVSEEFTNAPLAVRNGGMSAAWNFKIDGKSVVVANGRIKGADMEVCVDYAVALPSARMIYTEEMIKAGREMVPESSPMSKAPAYLSDLHNQLAVLTE